MTGFFAQEFVSLSLGNLLPHMKKFLISILFLAFSASGFSQFILYDGSAPFGYHVAFSGSGPSGAPDNTDGALGFLITAAGCNIIADGTVNSMTLYAGSSLTISSSSTLTINGSAIVNSGASITVEDGSTLIVNNNIDNAATITIETGGNLIQTHTGGASLSGSGTYVINAQGTGSSSRFNLWSSPINSTNLTSTFSSSNPCDMFAYVANSQDWAWDIVGTHTCAGTSYNFDSENMAGADGIMDVSRGYLVTGGGSTTFSGTINDGDHTIAISTTSIGDSPNWAGDDWNLIGNPYPSSIDATLFWNANSSIISGALYFWDDDASSGAGYHETVDFATWNLSGGTSSNSGVTPNGSIPLGQGFFVNGSSSGNVSFTNAMRGGSNSQFFKTETDIERIWINATSPNAVKNQVLFAFTDVATDGYDHGYDAPKLMGNTSFSFGSIMESEPYTIQAFPKIQPYDEKEIAIQLWTEIQGVTYVSLDHTEGLDTNITYYIRDNQTGKIQNLATGPFAVYLNANQVYDDRFTLVFKNEGPVPTGVRDAVQNDFSIYAYDNVLYVKSDAAPISNIEIINVNGSAVFQGAFNGVSETISLSQFPKGVYVARVITDSQGIKSSTFVIQ